MLVPVPQPLLPQPPANVIACGTIALLMNRLLGTGCRMPDRLIIIVAVVVVLTLTRIIKSVVTGQAPVTLELRNPPGKTHTTQGGTRIYHS